MKVNSALGYLHVTAAVGEWSDALTGPASVSLGVDAYRRIIVAERRALVAEPEDEGENHYTLTVKL